VTPQLNRVGRLAHPSSTAATDSCRTPASPPLRRPASAPLLQAGLPAAAGCTYTPVAAPSSPACQTGTQAKVIQQWHSWRVHGGMVGSRGGHEPAGKRLPRVSSPLLGTHRCRRRSWGPWVPHPFPGADAPRHWRRRRRRARRTMAHA
jgi:hypothetical protein